MTNHIINSAEAAVIIPETNNTTVTNSEVPSVNTTVTVNGTDTTTAVRDTGTTVLLVAIPTAVGGLFLILGVIIAVIISCRILRRRKQKVKNNSLRSEHGNIQTEQTILNIALCPEHVNIHTQHVLKQMVMNNRPPYPENEFNNQQNILKHKARNVTPYPGNANIETQQNILKLKQQGLSNTVPCPEQDGNIVIQQNTSYGLSDDETAINPPVCAEVDVQPVYAVADSDSHACTSEGGEYYVNDSLPSCPNVKKGSSQKDCEIEVDKNGAYNAKITHSQSPIYDGIYY